MKIPKRFNPEPINTNAVIAAAQDDAQALVASGDGALPESVEAIPVEGAPFVIDVLVPEGIETGDARLFEIGSIDTRDFPLPLFWQISTGEAHNGSVIVGRIDSAERLGEIEVAVPAVEGEENPTPTTQTTATQGWGNARGVFDSGPYGREAERLVRGGFLRGVSVDLDKFEASVELATEDDVEPEGNTIKNEKLTINGARITGATLVGKPAFQECTIRIEDAPVEPELPIEDGLYEEASDDPEMEYAALTASAAPVIPPREWFDRPSLKGPTPITVTDDGRVFGHIAAWGVSHIGLPRATKPPRSHSNYAYFRTGVLRTDNGSDVPVGQLTLAGGHASMSASASEAVKHYDDTASAVADVTAGEDSFGIWVAGSIRPEATPSQIRALRASAPSGDWRPINGRLELVAVCQVNVPGFPVARAMVAGGQMMALVAAGASAIAELRTSPVEELAQRVMDIERADAEKTKANALSAIQPLIDKRNEALAAKAAEASAKIAPLVDKRNQELETVAANARKAILGD